MRFGSRSKERSFYIYLTELWKKTQIILYYLLCDVSLSQVINWTYFWWRVVSSSIAAESSKDIRFRGEWSLIAMLWVDQPRTHSLDYNLLAG